jgi:parallel beta-helix repeat protein
MRRRRAAIFVVACLAVLAVMLGPAALPSGPAARGAEPACLPSTELYYDDGTVTDYVSTTCPSCSDVQGVRFSLPAGLASATISSVRFWCRPASPGASVEVWILGADHQTDLVPHITYAVGSTGWQTVQPAENVVSGDFFVFVRRLDRGTSLGYDYWNDAHRSFTGEHPSAPTDLARGGDIMIRATVEAAVHVGQGQLYPTIQAAIDAACAGVTIHVHPGTYTENVTVSKAVTITSTGGPSQTTVQSPSGRRSTFTVTAPGVSLSGFTIKGATDTGRAAVSISGVSGCVISGNVITNNNLGVYLSEGSAQNIVVENELRSNSNAIYVDGSQSCITGNKIHGNTAALGSAVFFSGSASGNQLSFNSITLDPGMGAGPHVYNQSAAEDVRATENWWGDAGGPGNAGGQGPSAGEGIVYEPWLAAAPSRVKTVAAAAGDFTVAARNEASVTFLGKSTAATTVSVVGFTANPAGEFPAGSMGKWVDVQVGSGGGLESAEIRVHYTAQERGDLDEGSLRLYWWDGSKWTLCSDSGVDKSGGFVWAKLDGDGQPGPADLQGTLFAVGTAAGGRTISWWLIPAAILIVVVLLIAFRLFWVLVVRRSSYLVLLTVLALVAPVAVPHDAGAA